MRLLLDTTVLIDVLRGRAAAERVRALRAGGERPLWVSAISVHEIHCGARPAEREAIDTLINGLQVASVGRREAEVAGGWRRDFGKRGVTLSQADTLIAANAHVLGARLATGNVKDYPMPDLEVDHWPVGA
jgi:predicted nucleic acid-binding protein